MNSQILPAGPGLGHSCDYWTGTELVVDCVYPYRPVLIDGVMMMCVLYLAAVGLAAAWAYYDRRR